MRWWSVMCNSGCVFLYSWSLDCKYKGCLCSFCNEKMHKWGDGIVLSYVLKLHIDKYDFYTWGGSDVNCLNSLILIYVSHMTMLDKLIGDAYLINEWPLS